LKKRNETLESLKQERSELGRKHKHDLEVEGMKMGMKVNELKEQLRKANIAEVELKNRN